MLIPVLMVGDMPDAISFYVDILDFRLLFATPPEAPFYAVLERGDDELHLNLASEDRRRGGASLITVCDDVDLLFRSFVANGLSIPARPGSPVYEGPLDQSWGTREVYIDDPSGNTIIYQQR